MVSTAALPHTLKSITSTKINELSKQRAIFNQRRDEIVKAAGAAPDNRARARILLEGIARLNGHPEDAVDRDDMDKDIDASDVKARVDDWERNENINIRRFLFQVSYDPSVSEDVLSEWTTRIEQKLAFLSVKFDHASFYSDLVMEWVADLARAEGNIDQSSFEEVGRKEMHEQQSIWESIVFSPSDVDPSVVEDYLKGLFTSPKPSKEALKLLREKTRKFGRDFMNDRAPITTGTLEQVSKSLLETDLLSTEQASILRDFLRNQEVIQEVADVLTMRFASLDAWCWDPQGLPMELRRQLNGKYRVFVDADLIDALLFHYVGLEWCDHFQEVFTSFLRSRAWKSNRKPVPKDKRERREYFLDSSTRTRTRGSNCVVDIRRKMYEKDYFMSLFGTEGQSYDDDDGPANDRGASAVDKKHSLLHLLITESILHTTLHDEFTVVRSDFKWFGPSLSHNTIFAVFKFFGVEENWLSFFRRFLEAPVKFARDGPNAEAKVRMKGVPMSHALSNCFGETVLFCLDYAVNQYADGAYLYRLHDDFWFWGEEETCVKAWETTTTFARTFGLEFNEGKTGTARLGKKNITSGHSESDLLPEGDIRWGFLKLDPSTGAFVIDQDQVDTHIGELRHQLAACNSLFAWVQAWNSYFARFFSNNFAKPAVCFGRDHIDMVIRTLNRIERQVFSATEGTVNGIKCDNVTDYLRAVIEKRFNVRGLPDGFFYFPIELGGLGLHNPFIAFLGMREDIRQTPKRRLQKAFIDEEANYLVEKEKYEKMIYRSRPAISLEEYMEYPEMHSRALLSAYEDLLRTPDEIHVNRSPGFRVSELWLDDQKDGAICNNWYKMSPYWKWVAELYHTGMVQKYGGLAAVERKFMPLGVLKVLKQYRVR
jgi:hypothetical protein